jgi:hypothetical protein
VAVEVRPRALAAVRLTKEGGRRILGAAASLDLPEGVLEPSLTRPNVLDPAAFRRALETLLERAGALEAGRLALVLPDPVLRLTVLPAADLKARGRAEMEELLRFRLHKALPFDVKEARLAWSGPREGSVVVAAIVRVVLEDYEKALAELGKEPGLVEPAALALLAALESEQGDQLLVNWDAGYVSLVLARGAWPLVLRTLSGQLGPEAVAREVAHTVLYYRDKLGGPGLARAVVRSSALAAEDAAVLLRDAIGFDPDVLDAGAAAGVDVRGHAGQQVAGALCCLGGRAA